jgi:hypothetical protein
MIELGECLMCGWLPADQADTGVRRHSSSCSSRPSDPSRFGRQSDGHDQPVLSGAQG